MTEGCQHRNIPAENNSYGVTADNRAIITQLCPHCGAIRRVWYRKGFRQYGPWQVQVMV